MKNKFSYFSFCCYLLNEHTRPWYSEREKKEIEYLFVLKILTRSSTLLSFGRCSLLAIALDLRKHKDWFAKNEEEIMERNGMDEFTFQYFFFNFTFPLTSPLSHFPELTVTGTWKGNGISWGSGLIENLHMAWLRCKWII